MENEEIARIFWEIAELLELKDENLFKVRAYQKAAQNIESLTDSLDHLYRQGGLKIIEEIPGIGEHTALKIEELLKTGKLKYYRELLKEFPKDFLELTRVPGMGPKTTTTLYKKLKIDTMAKLEKAAKAGQLRVLPGFGAKKEQNILRGIDLKKKSHGRFLLDAATAHAEFIMEELSKLKEAERILPCGSLRRGQETIGDLDILVVSRQPKIIMDAFVRLSPVKDVLAKGETKSSVILKNGMQADVRVVEAKSFGAAAHYFTGSKAHNIHLRQLAQKKGWKVSEYGIFKGQKQIGGATEEEMFSRFNLQWIPPELREMRGEFDAAAKGKIPHLIELKDIKGDLHAHTTASDGVNSIEEMALAAKKLGYEYLAITDHSVSTRVANGLDKKRLLTHLLAVRAAQKKLKGITLLAGSEVDIRPDGSLDYPAEILKQLDIVLISIHSNFKMTRDKMTRRIIKALENKYAQIFCHPTGRLINEREAYEVDMEALLQAAKKRGTIIELNANPRRLDLTDVYCQRAKELNIKIVISTDAHSTDQLSLMKYGVITARRGWLEKKNVINTLPLKQFLLQLASR